MAKASHGLYQPSQQYCFAQKLAQHELDLKVLNIETMQINLTKMCNQACVHCHVDSSPRRKEAMSDEVINQIIQILETEDEINTLDITGGAPELHPRFTELVKKARALGKHVMVRHNLTVTLDPHPVTAETLDYLPQFFAAQGVEVISSLPYYQEYFTDRQRGSGVFQKSIESLKRLNSVGYGQEGSGLVLNLVYNPAGAFLPAEQGQLEANYKKHLFKNFGITFNHLYAITNMPIHRFKVQLKRLNGLEEYMERLVTGFNPVAAQGIMCRSMVSVDYEGNIFDCDFNQVLNLPARGKPTIFNWAKDQLKDRTIQTDDHCFGCTAGAGSSCGGNTTDE